MKRAYLPTCAGLEDLTVQIVRQMRSLRRMGTGNVMMARSSVSEVGVDPTVHHVKTSMKDVQPALGKNVSIVFKGTGCPLVNAGRTGGDQKEMKEYNTKHDFEYLYWDPNTSYINT